MREHYETLHQREERARRPGEHRRRADVAHLPGNCYVELVAHCPSCGNYRISFRRHTTPGVDDVVSVHASKRTEWYEDEHGTIYMHCRSCPRVDEQYNPDAIRERLARMHAAVGPGGRLSVRYEDTLGRS